jgi:hypothetical protein
MRLIWADVVTLRNAAAAVIRNGFRIGESPLPTAGKDSFSSKLNTLAY